jgi:hypothetical protein
MGDTGPASPFDARERTPVNWQLRGQFIRAEHDRVLGIQEKNRHLSPSPRKVRRIGKPRDFGGVG